MATIKVALDKRAQKKDQTYPIKIRVYSGTAYKQAGIGKSVLEKDFDVMMGSFIKFSSQNFNLSA